MILNEHPVSYLDEMHGALTALLDNGPWRAWNHQPGGADPLRGDRMGEAERLLLSAVARVVLSGDRGDLSAQLEDAYRHWPDPEASDLVPSRKPDPPAAAEGSVAPPPLRLENGLGGFADGGREYVVTLDGAAETPLPWANVIANPAFGTIVTASGSAYTWAQEQPREPSDTFRQRSCQRSDLGGDLPAGRRDGRSLVGHRRARPPLYDDAGSWSGTRPASPASRESRAASATSSTSSWTAIDPGEDSPRLAPDERERPRASA